MYEFFKRIVGGFGDFLTWIYTNMIPDAVKEKFSGLNVGSFKGMIFSVLKIFTYWYFYMTVAGVIVVYRLFKALESSGILKKFGEIVDKAMTSVMYISEVCFPMILSLGDMMRCIAGSP